MIDTDSWQDWINTYGPQLVLFARRWAVDHAEAEDFVQEAFVRFWQSRGGVREQLPYLYRCVRNVAIDAARSQQARVSREATTANAEFTDAQFSQATDHDPRLDQLEAALAKLPTEQAEVVTLKIWSELTFAQIAEVTDTPAGTVASRYRYAMDRMRQILEG